MIGGEILTCGTCVMTSLPRMPWKGQEAEDWSKGLMENSLCFLVSCKCFSLCAFMKPHSETLSPGSFSAIETCWDLGETETQHNLFKRRATGQSCGCIRENCCPETTKNTKNDSNLVGCCCHGQDLQLCSCL